MVQSIGPAGTRAPRIVRLFVDVDNRNESIEEWEVVASMEAALLEG